MREFCRLLSFRLDLLLLGLWLWLSCLAQEATPDLPQGDDDLLKVGSLLRFSLKAVSDEISEVGVDIFWYVQPLIVPANGSGDLHSIHNITYCGTTAYLQCTFSMPVPVPPILRECFRSFLDQLRLEIGGTHRLDLLDWGKTVEERSSSL